jgi:hypothetical protein
VLAALLLTGAVSPGDDGGGGGNPPNTPTACDARQSITTQFAAWGIGADSLRFGDQIDWNVPVDAGRGRFADQPLRSRESFLAFVQGGSPTGRLINQQLAEGLIKSVQNGQISSADAAHVAANGQIISVDIWTPVQINAPIDVYGNAAHTGGKVIIGPHARSVSHAGDIWWFAVSPTTCQVMLDLAVRADCGNAKVFAIVPKGAPKPPASVNNPPTGKTPTTKVPTTAPPTTVPPTCESIYGKRYHGVYPHCFKEPGTDGTNEPNQPPATDPPSNTSVNVGPTPNAPSEPACPRGTSRVNGHCVGTVAPPLFTGPTEVEPPLANDPPRNPQNNPPPPPPSGV